jgi:aryl-alcohol dehydrogenase-like predicted oxidoreductase
MSLPKRPLGETGHESTILTLGAIALSYLDQTAATELATEVLDAGVNHVDVAPTYGDAEAKLAPTLADYRDDVFLACKTKERTYNGAWGELHRSLDRLGVDHIDLYQFHAVTSQRELDTITGEYTPELAQDRDQGALAALRDAKDAGLISHVGLTSHGDPALVRDAIDRIPDLETVMFPYNATVAAKSGPEHDYEAVHEKAKARGLGTIGIKAFAKGPWNDDRPREERPYRTWYEPYDDPAVLADCLRFALSSDLTTIANAGDPQLVAPILEAAETFEPLTAGEREAMLDAARDATSPVPRHF